MSEDAITILSVSGSLPALDIESVLSDAGFDHSVLDVVQSDFATGTYTHYTVELERRGAEVYLTVNTYFLDAWVDSVTGEEGHSPHGRLGDYLSSKGGEWTPGMCCEYGG